MTPSAVGTVFEPRGPVSADVEDLLRWAAASDDFSPIHFDPAVAASRGFPGPLVHGPWKAAVLRQLVASWLGEGTRVEALSIRYLRPDIVGHDLWFGGSVVSTEVGRDGATRIECELWVRNADDEISVAGECVARVEPDAAGSLPLARLEAAVRLGDVAGVFTYRVEENDVEAFASSIGAQPPMDGTAPPTYFAALDPVERRDLQLDAFLEDLPFEKTGGGNAFNEVEYQRPIRVGDVLTVSTRYSEVYEKAGSRGTLLFRVRVNEIRDADGVLVATSRCGHVLSYRVPGVAQ